MGQRHESINQSINQSIKFIISVAHCRLDFTKKNSRKHTSAMLNVNTTKITIVDETRECFSRQMMLTYFSARTEGRISYGHLGRTNSCYRYLSGRAISLPDRLSHGGHTRSTVKVIEISNLAKIFHTARNWYQRFRAERVKVNTAWAHWNLE